MQDPITPNEQDALHNNESLVPISHAPTGSQELASSELPLSKETAKGETPALETPSSLPTDSPHTQPRSFLPRRGLYYAALAGVIAGVLAALLTVVITLINTGTFHAAAQQIAVDRLTVKTALALVAWELLNFTLSLLIGFFVGLVVGKIAVRRRLGFLAGAIAGAIFYLILFFVSLIPSYPGNLTLNGTTTTTGSLIVSLLLLCLWAIGGGLVSLFGTWVATVRHLYYMTH